jgi:hypothetical protein
MPDWAMDVKGEGVAMTAQQLEALMKFGAETGGTIEVYAADEGAVRVVALGDQEFLYRPDGSAERLN